MRNPRSETWNVEVDRQVLDNLLVRVAYQQRNTFNSLVLNPEVQDTDGLLSLASRGRDFYREFQVTGRYQIHRQTLKVEPFQERLGGRIALVAEINIGGSRLVAYNLHLESRGNDELRLSQVGEVLSDAARWKVDYPVVIAGDLNLDASKSSAATAFGQLGFRDAVGTRGMPTTPPRRILEAGRRIDWAFIRGPVRAVAGKVHDQVKASDHYPISFTLTA